MISLINKNTIVTIYRYYIQLPYIVTLLFLLREYIRLLYSVIGYRNKYIVETSQSPHCKGHLKHDCFYSYRKLQGFIFISNSENRSKVMIFHYKTP